MLEKAFFFKSIADSSLLFNRRLNDIEIIVSGRSNVGKSSVINTLCSQKKMARTSKSPGRTKCINIYSVSENRFIVDLPGYGFANVSMHQKKLWNEMIYNYLIRKSSKKKAVYLVIDIFVGPTELDFSMIDWLNKFRIFYKIVANKYDKIRMNITGDEVKIKMANFLGINKSKIFIVSAKNKIGFRELKSDVIKFFS
jgi:GTP-binding protein